MNPKWIVHILLLLPAVSSFESPGCAQDGVREPLCEKILEQVIQEPSMGMDERGNPKPSLQDAAVSLIKDRIPKEVVVDLIKPDSPELISTPENPKNIPLTGIRAALQSEVQTAEGTYSEIRALAIQVESRSIQIHPKIRGVECHREANGNIRIRLNLDSTVINGPVRVGLSYFDKNAFRGQGFNPLTLYEGGKEIPGLGGALRLENPSFDVFVHVPERGTQVQVTEVKFVKTPEFKVLGSVDLPEELPLEIPLSEHRGALKIILSKDFTAQFKKKANLELTQRADKLFTQVAQKEINGEGLTQQITHGLDESKNYLNRFIEKQRKALVEDGKYVGALPLQLRAELAKFNEELEKKSEERFPIRKKTPNLSIGALEINRFNLLSLLGQLIRDLDEIKTPEDLKNPSNYDRLRLGITTLQLLRTEASPELRAQVISYRQKLRKRLPKDSTDALPILPNEIWEKQWHADLASMQSRFQRDRVEKPEFIIGNIPEIRAQLAEFFGVVSEMPLDSRRPWIFDNPDLNNGVETLLLARSRMADGKRVKIAINEEQTRLREGVVSIDTLIETLNGKIPYLKVPIQCQGRVVPGQNRASFSIPAEYFNKAFEQLFKQGAFYGLIPTSTQVKGSDGTIETIDREKIRIQSPPQIRFADGQAGLIHLELKTDLQYTLGGGILFVADPTADATLDVQILPTKDGQGIEIKLANLKEVHLHNSIATWINPLGGVIANVLDQSGFVEQHSKTEFDDVKNTLTKTLTLSTLKERHLRISTVKTQNGKLVFDVEPAGLLATLEKEGNPK